MRTSAIEHEMRWRALRKVQESATLLPSGALVYRNFAVRRSDNKKKAQPTLVGRTGAAGFEPGDTRVLKPGKSKCQDTVNARQKNETALAA